MTYDVRFSLWRAAKPSDEVFRLLTLKPRELTADTKAIFVNNKSLIEVYFSLRPVTVGSQVKTCSELTS